MEEHPVGLSSSATAEAVRNTGRVDHASRHLIDVGVIKGVSKGSNSARRQFRKIAAGILEQPEATFDHILRGKLEAKGFVGAAGSEPVVIFVSKQARGKVQRGEVVTAVKPSKQQLSRWLNR